MLVNAPVTAQQPADNPGDSDRLSPAHPGDSDIQFLSLPGTLEHSEYIL